jgi:hypothetical protein
MGQTLVQRHAQSFFDLYVHHSVSTIWIWRQQLFPSHTSVEAFTFQSPDDSHKFARELTTYLKFENIFRYVRSYVVQPMEPMGTAHCQASAQATGDEDNEGGRQRPSSVLDTRASPHTKEMLYKLCIPEYVHNIQSIYRNAM